MSVVILATTTEHQLHQGMTEPSNVFDAACTLHGNRQKSHNSFLGRAFLGRTGDLCCNRHTFSQVFLQM